MKRDGALSKIFLVKHITFLGSVALLCCTASVHASLTAEAVLNPNTVSLNKEFTYQVIVTWQGSADEYIIVPPAPEFPEGISSVSSSFFSSAGDNAYLLTYSFILKAAQKGSYTIDPLKISYWEKGSDQESSLRTNEALLEVVLLAAGGINIFWYIIGGAAALLTAILVIALITNRRADKKKGAGTGSAQDADSILESFSQCKECKLQGDFRGFYEHALNLFEQLSPEDIPALEPLQAALEKVQFGGQVPPTHEIDRLFRQLEKAVEQETSDKQNRDAEIAKYCKD